jgi:peptidyl-tRNA hydrolase
MIEAYFTNIKSLVEKYAATMLVLETQLQLDSRRGGQGYLTGQILFEDLSELHFKEYLNEDGETVEKLMYSYHYQTHSHQLIFRYDNARHRPALPSLEHKHTELGEVVPSLVPTLSEVLLEVVKRWDRV